MKGESRVALAVSNDRQLAQLNVARQALMRAESIPDVKRIADVAAAAEIYAKRQKLSEEVIGSAHALKIHALGKLGDMLKELPKATGSQGQLRGRDSSGGYISEPPELTSTQTLSDLGLDKRTSMIAQQLARLDEVTRLQIAERELSIANAMRQHRNATKVITPLPIGVFRVLYADPPWSYRNSGAIDDLDSYGRAARHYPTMTIDELCALPVRDHVASNAVLFLWVTSPLLAECWPVITAWGFSYKASMVWHKDAHNYGFYVSVEHEFLLICTRGSCVPDHPVPMPSSVLTIRKSRVHSEKPEEFRQIIDRLYDGAADQKLELFGRRLVPGWSVYGNEWGVAVPDGLRDSHGTQ